MLPPAVMSNPGFEGAGCAPPPSPDEPPPSPVDPLCAPLPASDEGAASPDEAPLDVLAPSCDPPSTLPIADIPSAPVPAASPPEKVASEPTHAAAPSDKISASPRRPTIARTFTVPHLASKLFGCVVRTLASLGRRAHLSGKSAQVHTRGKDSPHNRRFLTQSPGAPASASAPASAPGILSIQATTLATSAVSTIDVAIGGICPPAGLFFPRCEMSCASKLPFESPGTIRVQCTGATQPGETAGTPSVVRSVSNSAGVSARPSRYAGSSRRRMPTP